MLFSLISSKQSKNAVRLDCVLPAEMKRFSRNAVRSVARARFLSSSAVCDTRRRNRQEKGSLSHDENSYQLFSSAHSFAVAGDGQKMKISSAPAKKKDTEGSKEPSVSLANNYNYDTNYVLKIAI